MDDFIERHKKKRQRETSNARVEKTELTDERCTEIRRHDFLERTRGEGFGVRKTFYVEATIPGEKM